MKAKTEEQIKKQISDIELHILQLTELQNLCYTLNKDENENESDKQNDSELLDLLKKNYDLDDETTSSIKLKVKGKKKTNTVDLKILKMLRNKFDSYCVICNINKNTKDNKFMGYPKFSNKCSNKKNILKRKLDELNSELTSYSKNESASEPTNPSETTPV